jgi:tetratricopeptide (TPR) repeat protein
MEFDWGWILLGLPLAFVLGWLASRMDLRQLRLENRHNPKAYFKGLNYLLNEQQDQAIDAFIQAVQQDPDTSELHFALGSLFRRRGEFERSVRVHQHLLARDDLSTKEHERAQLALAMDYLRAGLLDRAEESYRKLLGTSFQTQAQLALLSIFERTRDWKNAQRIAEELDHAGLGEFKTRQAHYLCEEVEQLLHAKGTSSAELFSQAKSLLDQAILMAPQSARAPIALARLEHQSGQISQAHQTLLRLVEMLPASLPLVCEELLSCARALGKEAELKQILQKAYDAHASLDVLKALSSLQTTTTELQQLLSRHLQDDPSLLVASWWLEHERIEHEEQRPYLQKALIRATSPLNRYRCAACGFEAQKHFWQCPGCQAWDSYPNLRVEEL